MQPKANMEANLKNVLELCKVDVVCNECHTVDEEMDG